MKKFFADFKKFISRGNIVDMAIGVIIGTAFSAIVTALTNKILMPFINLLLSIGGAGLESAYTILKPVYDENNVLDLTKSIYIDWGAFITAIINFLIIALTLFIILKITMNARGYITKLTKKSLTKEQKKELKEKGISLKDKDSVKAYLLEKEEEQKELARQEEEKKKLEEEEKYKNSTEYLLKEIRDLLKENKELKEKVAKPVKATSKAKAKKAV